VTLMTLYEARKRLSQPLRFGDDSQIEAVNFIAKAEKLADAMAACPHGCGECDKCSGSGECDHCGGECGECGGDGVVFDCACFPETPDINHVKAAELIIRERSVKAVAA
jgi:hypothetical protein